MRVGDGHSCQSHRNLMHIKRRDNIRCYNRNNRRQQNEIKENNLPTTNKGKKIRANAIIFCFHRVIGNRKTIPARFESIGIGFPNITPCTRTAKWRALSRRMETDQLHAPWKPYPLSDVVIIIERDMRSSPSQLNVKWKISFWHLGTFECARCNLAQQHSISFTINLILTHLATPPPPFRRSAI